MAVCTLKLVSQKHCIYIISSVTNCYWSFKFQRLILQLLITGKYHNVFNDSTFAIWLTKKRTVQRYISVIWWSFYSSFLSPRGFCLWLYVKRIWVKSGGILCRLCKTAAHCFQCVVLSLGFPLMRPSDRNKVTKERPRSNAALISIIHQHYTAKQKGQNELRAQSLNVPFPLL